MNKAESQIMAVKLLENLAATEIRKYLDCGRFKVSSYKANSVIHFENDPCDKLEIILSGEVLVERLDAAGGLLTIASFSANDILGGNLLFSQNPYYPMTITARKTSSVLEIDRELLFEMLGANSAVLRRFLAYMSDHSAILSLKIRSSIKRTIRESVLLFLDAERQRQGSSRIVLNMTKKELAERIGVQRTSLSRELAKMRSDGLIEFDTDSITIRQFDRP